MLFGNMNDGHHRSMCVGVREFQYLFKLIKSLISGDMRLFVFHYEFTLLCLVDLYGSEMTVLYNL